MTCFSPQQHSESSQTRCSIKCRTTASGSAREACVRRCGYFKGACTTKTANTFGIDSRIDYIQVQNAVKIRVHATVVRQNWLSDASCCPVIRCMSSWSHLKPIRVAASYYVSHPYPAACSSKPKKCTQSILALCPLIARQNYYQVQ